MDKDISTAPAPGPSVEAPRQEKPRILGNTVATLSLIVCIGAWIAMVYNEGASAALAIAALVMAIVGCFMTRRGLWRDVAITAIIASCVLLLVFAAFSYGLDMLVKSL